MSFLNIVSTNRGTDICILNRKSKTKTTYVSKKSSFSDSRKFSRINSTRFETWWIMVLSVYPFPLMYQVFSLQQHSNQWCAPNPHITCRALPLRQSLGGYKSSNLRYRKLVLQKKWYLVLRYYWRNGDVGLRFWLYHTILQK